MKNIFIGISGQRQSGKSSLAKFLQYYVFYKNTRLSNLFTINQKDEYPNDVELISVTGHSITVSDLWLHSQIVSFADAPKNFLVDVMGLRREQVFGSDEEKNTDTEYSWDKLPLFIRERYKNDKGDIPTGKMSSRRLMQIVLTDIFREMFSDSIWINRAISKANADFHKDKISIKNVGVEKYFTFIPDVRFVSEIEALKNLEDSYIIRLQNNNNKSPAGSHKSETELDNFDWTSLGNKVKIIDTTEISIHKKNFLASEFMNSVIA